MNCGTITCELCDQKSDKWNRVRALLHQGPTAETTYVSEVQVCQACMNTMTIDLSGRLTQRAMDFTRQFFKFDPTTLMTNKGKNN